MFVMRDEYQLITVQGAGARKIKAWELWQRRKRKGKLGKGEIKQRSALMIAQLCMRHISSTQVNKLL